MIGKLALLGCVVSMFMFLTSIVLAKAVLLAISIVMLVVCAVIWVFFGQEGNTPPDGSNRPTSNPSDFAGYG